MAALFADVGPEPQEFAVDSVQDGLEVLTLPGILAIKQLQELWEPGSEVRKEAKPGYFRPIPMPPQRACPCPMTPPGLGSPLHHQDKLLIHISLGHRGLEVWALQETQEKLIYQLEEGTDNMVSSGTASPFILHCGPQPTAQDLRRPSTPPWVSSETHSPVFPSPPT